LTDFTAITLVRQEGAGHIPAYVEHLTARQYAPSTTRAYLGCVAIDMPGCAANATAFALNSSL